MMIVLITLINLAFNDDVSDSDIDLNTQTMTNTSDINTVDNG